ncbi:MAG: DUF4093 domain-containing protein [Eubacteriales bacterium]|nr:DUF4093 domain-containing protein [Eubacteriales bacterium]
MERAKIKLIYPLVVEGKYDKIKLACIVSSPIITLDGFSAFNNAEKKSELIAFGKRGGLIILTDSDKAGTFIRGKLKGLLPGCELINIYAPAVAGKDPRRNHTNKEGILGVESLDCDILYELLKPLRDQIHFERYLTRQRAYADGICGCRDSVAARKALCRALSLPESISAQSLIEYINSFVSEDEYSILIRTISKT